MKEQIGQQGLEARGKSDTDGFAPVQNAQITKEMDLQVKSGGHCRPI
jgi:hypothetical protein